MILNLKDDKNKNLDSFLLLLIAISTLIYLILLDNLTKMNRNTIQNSKNFVRVKKVRGNAIKIECNSELTLRLISHSNIMPK